MSEISTNNNLANSSGMAHLDKPVSPDIFTVKADRDKLVDEPKSSDAVAAPSDKEALPSDKQNQVLKEAVSKLNEYVKSTERDLEFSFDEDVGRPIVTVLDRETQEVVRTLPGDVALKLARNLNQDDSLSLLVDQA